MSWDVLLMPLPAEPASIDELPDDHEPPPIGSRAGVHEAVREACGEVDLTDPAWGELLGPTWVIELNIGGNDPVASVMLHVRGGEDDVLPVIWRLAGALGCRPFDCSAGELLTEGVTAGWHNYQAFRDRALAAGSADVPETPAV